MSQQQNPMQPQFQPQTGQQPVYQPQQGYPQQAQVPQGVPASMNPQMQPPMQGGPPGMGQQMQQVLSGGPIGGSRLGQYDMSGIATKNFELLPADVAHEARVVSAKMGKTDAGDDMIVLEVETVTPMPGVSLTDYVPLSAAGIWKFKALCLATGLGSPDGARFIGQSEQDFVGRFVRFMVRHSEWDGELRNKIKGGVMPPRECVAAAGVPTVPNYQAVPAQQGYPLTPPQSQPAAPAPSYPQPQFPQQPFMPPQGPGMPAPQPPFQIPQGPMAEPPHTAAEAPSPATPQGLQFPQVDPATGMPMIPSLG